MSEEQSAFVLAGGGTKGAFEVGVVGHLVGVAGLVPDIITAASAGSIIAGVLAQARTPDELSQRVAEMRADLLAMTDLTSVFARQPWLDDLQGTPIGDAVDTFLEMRPPPPDDPGAPHRPPPSTPAPPAPPSASSSPARAHHLHLSWHQLVAAVTALPSLNRARKHFEGHASSFLTLDPLERALRGQAGTAAGIAPVDPALVARPGLRFRVALTDLELGELRFVTEAGVLVDGDAVTPSAVVGGPVDLIDGILASASAPILFPSRTIAGRAYCDGGAMQNLPVGAAVALGATHIYAVAAMPLAIGPDGRDWSTATFFDLHLRSSQIMFFDHQRANLEAARPPGVELTVIAPTVDVVGAFEVNEGLMALDMDYGDLRAQEVLAPLTDEVRAQAMELTDHIVVARDRAWFAEEALWHTTAPPSAAALDSIRQLKAEIRAALDARVRLGLASPATADAWSSAWEPHQGTPPTGLPDAP